MSADPALDAGFRSGWGVFETMRAHGTATLGLEAHLARLADGAGRLGIAVDVAQVRHEVLARLAESRDAAEVVVRVTLTAGPVDVGTWPATPIGRPTLAITLHPAPPLPMTPVAAACVKARRWPADVKATSYVASILATEQARAAGADVAVLVDGDELLETAEGNLLALVDGVLITPPADGRLLPGVLRGLVLEAAVHAGVDVHETPLRRDVARRAELLLVTSAVAEVRTVHTFDGARIAGSGHDDAPLHPLVTTLRAELAARRATGA